MTDRTEAGLERDEFGFPRDLSKVGSEELLELTMQLRCRVNVGGSQGPAYELAVAALRERLRPRQGGNGSTHWEGCWEARYHHDCAVHEVERLQAIIRESPDRAAVGERIEGTVSEDDAGEEFTFYTKRPGFQPGDFDATLIIYRGTQAVSDSSAADPRCRCQEGTAMLPWGTHYIGCPEYPGPTPSAYRGEVGGKPHRCPVCTGTGLVPQGFYFAIGTPCYSAGSTAPEVCRACMGTGVIWELRAPFHDSAVPLLSPPREPTI